MHQQTSMSQVAKPHGKLVMALVPSGGVRCCIAATLCCDWGRPVWAD